MGEGKEAGSRVGGVEGEHWRRRRGREADATGKKGKREEGRRGGGGVRWRGMNIPSNDGGERGVAGSACKGREGENGEKDKGEKEKKKRGKIYQEKRRRKRDSVSI